MGCGIYRLENNDWVENRQNLAKVRVKMVENRVRRAVGAKFRSLRGFRMGGGGAELAGRVGKRQEKG
jgi:hypothetical protein